jgi:LIM homeobox transcription factor 1
MTFQRRKRFTAEQTEFLQTIFQRNPMPDSQTRRWMAEQLNVSPKTVQIWFQNKRAKQKKENAVLTPVY